MSEGKMKDEKYILGLHGKNIYQLLLLLLLIASYVWKNNDRTEQGFSPSNFPSDKVLAGQSMKGSQFTMKKKQGHGNSTELD